MDIIRDDGAEFEELVGAVTPEFQVLGTGKIVLLVSTALLVILVAIRNLFAWTNSSQVEAKPPYYSLVAPPEAEGETEIHRSRLAEEELVSLFDASVTTLYENFRRSVTNFPHNPCVGTRVNDGPFEWKTYLEVQERVNRIGSALLHLGLGPGDLVGISARNREEWTFVTQACNAYSMVCVPVYHSFATNAKLHVVQEGELRVLFCDAEHLTEYLGIADECSALQYLVTFDDVTVEQDAFAREKRGVTVLRLEELEERAGDEVFEHVPPHPEEVAMICYTSGTTNMPKGVLLTHANLIADGAGAIVSGNIELRDSDVHLSYLPLAHTFENMVTLLMISAGGRIGFFRGNVREHLFDDIQELKPTIFPSVPKLFNRIHDRVVHTVAAYPAWKRRLFQVAFNTKRQRLRQGIYSHYLWDILVFNRVRALLGGRVRMMLIGSAPIFPDVLDFMRVCFSCEVFEGYGQTECCAAACCSVPGTMTHGNVGAPLPCAEVKLVDVPSMNYLSSDEPYARGEICVRGPIVCKGYFKKPELTMKVIDKDGWLHTGDIGMWLDDGTLRVVDRIANIFKLAQGEFVSPEKVEGVVVQSKYVAMAFVHGYSLKSALVAVIVPDEPMARAWASRNNLEKLSMDALCLNEELKKEILTDITLVCRENMLAGYEIPQAITLEEHMFTPQNGLLSPTFKVKRAACRDYYRQAIDEMYMTLR
eukprot:CAMPEP_0114614478 /NCGR_PEP_ID=MMETSP0168-20121206/5676_1 /TAXON_ID=95228 ORGANISM="Vannella sp., Strain DIVA3 517/6/12" /NCGR_SAMPLE_ID=MMETSP0168 /ASSEMBLY_ACC=CAM_ASM_000044 /LENGTH=704 /DNA_ID=CAMNT_0001825531 /DNA_START=98 /DNA_END=2212 /DNA_ORIENTATION=+